MRKPSHTLAELGIALPRDGLFPVGFVSLEALGEDAACRAAMDEERVCHPALDDKGCAAYLVDRIGYELGRLAGALHLAGLDLGAVTPGQVAVRAIRIEDDEGSYLDSETALATLPGELGTASATRSNMALVTMARPLVQAAASASGLSRNALWRLVGDGILAAFIEFGRQRNERDTMIAAAQAILQVRPSPLWNRQCRTLWVDVPAEASPTSQPLRDAFRQRGGCCRAYTISPTGALCPTCVLQPDHVPVLQQRRIEMASH